MAGIADLVTALATGGNIEQGAYDRETQRIIDAQTAQATLAKRMQEAANLQKEAAGKDMLGNIFAQFGMDAVDQNYQLTPQQIGTAYRYGTQGNVDVAKLVEGLQQQVLRERLLNERVGAGYSPDNALADAYFDTEVRPNSAAIGKVIVDNPYGKAVVNEMLTGASTAQGAKVESAARMRQFEAEIQSLVDQGMPLHQAQNIVFERRRIEQNDLGQVVAIDETLPLDRAVQSVPIGGLTTGDPIPPPDPGDTLYELGVHTGPAAYGKSLAGQFLDIIPFVDLPAWAEPVVDAHAKFKANTRDLVRALAKTRAFREQEWILDELSVKPGVLKGAGTLRTQIDSLRDVLERMLAQEMRDANDPSVGKETQEESKANVSILQNFLPVLGGSEVQGQQAITPEQRAAAEAALIDVPGFVDELTPDEREEMIMLWVQKRMQ